MTRPYNTQHLDRSTSTYARKHKAAAADRYGSFDNGRQIAPDKIAGRSLWYPVKKEAK